MSAVEKGANVTKQCSEIFEKVFDTRGSGCVRKCACGITYFDGSDWSAFYEGELEELRRKAQETPDKFVEWNQSVGCMEIGGQSIVYGCNCDTAQKYEQFIVNYSEQLAKYLNMRAAALRRKAGMIGVNIFP